MLELVRSNTKTRVPPPMAAGATGHDATWDDVDDAHGAVWQAVRHLFPANAMVDQVGYGCLLVAWQLRHPSRRSWSFAAPVMIRIAPGLLVALWTSDGPGRRDLAELQAEVVSDALATYDPHSRVPTCDVIRLGD
jgi:hypothetical protein